MSDVNGYDPALDPNANIKSIYTWLGDGYPYRPSYTYNTDRWLKDVDLSCHCADPIQYNSTVVSPIHTIQSGHGATPLVSVKFVDMNNVAYARTIVDSHDFRPTADLRILTLDSPLPPSIKPAKVLPDNWPDYFPGVLITDGTPGTFFDRVKNQAGPSGYIITQDRFALSADWIQTYIGAFGNNTTFGKPIDPKRNFIWQIIRPGDSGSPALIVVNGESVLVEIIASGGDYPAGADVTHFKSLLNDFMSIAGYSLTEVNLDAIIQIPLVLAKSSQVSRQVRLLPNRAI